MTLVWLVLALAPLSRPGDPATLAATPEEAARARALVRQLGSPVYQEREAASRALARLGASAVAQLEAAEYDSDAEVRARVGRLLPPARADDTERRLRLFVLDWAGRYEHNLPGWPLFASLAGDTPAARGLFAEVARVPEHRPLLVAVANVGELPAASLAVAGGLGAARLHRPAAESLGPPLRARRLELGPPAETVPWSEILNPSKRRQAEEALVLFAEALAPAAELVWGDGREYRIRLPLVGGDGSLLGRGASGAALPALYRRWADAQTAPSGLAEGLVISDRLGPPATAVAAAARLLADERARPRYRIFAARVLGWRGTPAVLPTQLAAVDARGSEWFLPARPGWGGAIEVGVGHAALAYAILLAKRRPQDFGFVTASTNGVEYCLPLADSAGRTQAAQFAAAKLRFRDSLAECHGALAGPAGALAPLFGPACDFGP